MTVYMNDISAFLPNDPVDNDHIQDVIGRIHDLPSKRTGGLSEGCTSITATVQPSIVRRVTDIKGSG